MNASLAHAAHSADAQSRRLLLVLLMAATMIVSSAAVLSADPGAGTKFFACRDAAHAAEKVCYTAATGFWESAKCFAAHELDLLGCDAALIRALNPLAS
jgi:hypothetical protein